ncbi:MAG TPA: hypothetical protein DDZ68_04330 [Parvularcula sp.]|nr:hypothetical protein [Parvularcula sp.]HBS36029.1 hypothetical protein [Parvularcula sp.]
MKAPDDRAVIGFLFNHDAGHQAGHLTPILGAYADARPQDDVCAFVAPGEVADMVRKATARPNVRIVELKAPAALSAPARVLDLAFPASRSARLRSNLAAFSGLDALVTPEHAALKLKPLIPAGVSFIYSGHGAGDRAYGFDAALSAFDLILAPGMKSVRRFKAAGAINGNAYALVGYPKFDAAPAAPERFFDNDNPVVLYNPHFSPAFSSWYRAGVKVLDWFAANKDLNLIFAPHVMLYRRPVHMTPGEGAIGWARRAPARFFRMPNIRIDVGSRRLFDMSYTAAADLYVGDASSQVLEFLLRPRPCVFFNAHGRDWRGDPNFAHWRCGEVVEDIESLGAAIRAGLASRDAYRLAQQEHFSDTFDLTHEPSAARAAAAIARFVDEKKQRRATGDLAGLRAAS